MKKIKDFAIITGGHFTQAVVLIVSTRLMTALLSPAQLGRFAIIYAVIAMFIALFISSVGTYGQRKLIEWNREGTLRFYTRQYIGYFLLAAVLVGLLIMGLKCTVGFAIDIRSVWIVMLTGGLLLFTNANSYFYNGLNILDRRLWFTVCLNLTLVLSLVFSAVLVVTHARTAEYWILGQVLGQAAVMIVAGILFFRIVRPPKSGTTAVLPRRRRLIKEVAAFAWPLSAASLILWAHGYAYQFLTERFYGLQVVGFFVVGYNLGTKLMEKFEGLFLSFYDPIFYTDIAHAGKKEKTQAWDRYARVFLPSVILLAAYICAGRHFLARLFLAPEFRTVSAETILWGALTALMTTSRSIYTKVSIAELKMTDLLAPYALGTYITLAGIVILAGRGNPYAGIGLSLFGGALAMLVYLMVKMHRLLPVSFPVKRAGLALALVLPMAGLFALSHDRMPFPSLVQALAVLAAGGLYALLAVAVLPGRDFWKRNAGGLKLLLGNFRGKTRARSA